MGPLVLDSPHALWSNHHRKWHLLVEKKKGYKMAQEQSRNTLPHAHTTDAAEKSQAVTLRISDIINLQASFLFCPPWCTAAHTWKDSSGQRCLTPSCRKHAFAKRHLPPVAHDSLDKPKRAGPGCPGSGQEARATQSCPEWRGFRDDLVASIHLKPHRFLADCF